MWSEIDNGETIGTIGSENGEIIKDEEHSKGARLTLEKDSVNAPYTLTSGVYGCFFHTTHLSNIKEGISEFEAMKAEISEFVNKETSIDEEYDWILAFVGRH
ncbi:hypothetical protein BIZ38_00020 [Pseudoalteromonas sp. BZK2]|uniref:hypothetical protein n=1 Tax=Pseudoalteromonas sp. BZK2 TaxID=1904458 RepID=UPI0016545E0C|nr:hypothetical protein [Pseudoalteromonas sp. BZK2]MBC7006827.1 hypothetical protein [Pseudoalteromonas sp. BZK2]